MADRFSVDSLRDALGDRPFRFYEQVTSTQDVARRWALEDPPPGAVVIAEEQTAGRGRGRRRWHSPPHSSVMFSAILRPVLTPEQLPRVTMAAGLALWDVLHPLLGDTFALKWPNDGMVRGKKICGILAEAAWVGDQLAAVMVGVGLNVRADFTGTELAGTATSLEAELGRAVDRHALLADLLARLDHWGAHVSDPALVPTWRSRLGTLGKRVTVYPGPQEGAAAPFAGIAEDVDEAGALVVRLDAGGVRRVFAGDVRIGENTL